MSKIILIIGNKNYSSWSLRPWLMLKHSRIPFEEILIPLYEPGSKEKILQHSPAGKVPVLKDGQFIVWESLAIGEYLADLFPEKNPYRRKFACKQTSRNRFSALLIICCRKILLTRQK